MNITQMKPIIKVAGPTPQQRYSESDQTYPAGMWRSRIQGDKYIIERATATDWSTSEAWMTFSKSDEEIQFGKTVNMPATVKYGDDEQARYGDDDDVAVLYSTADPDALAYVIGLPHVDENANNVAVMVLVDRDAVTTDRGAGGIDLSGITEPTLAIGNEASDAWCSIDAGDVNGAGVGLYFKAAADEDINILKLSVTGTPVIMWVEASDSIAYWENMILGTGEGGVTLVNDAVIRPPNLVSGVGDDDVAGADFYIKGALGRGAGDVGQIIFQTAQVAAADTVQTYETILTLDEDLATFAKNVNIGANQILFTNTLIKDGGDAIVTLRDDTDSSFAIGEMAQLWVRGTISILVDGSSIQGPNSDDNYYAFRVRDNGVSLKEVSRVQGAADPYVRIGRDDTGVATDAITDMLYLQAGAGSGNESAGFGFGLPVYLGNDASEVEERVSIDFVLVTATNGLEDARIDFNVMGGGSEVARVFQIASGAITLGVPEVIDVSDATLDTNGDIAATDPWHELIPFGGVGSVNDTINKATGGVKGQRLVLSAKTTVAGGNDQITIADGTGADTFILAGGAAFVLDHVDDRWEGLHNGTEWVEQKRSSNS